MFEKLFAKRGYLMDGGTTGAREAGSVVKAGASAGRVSIVGN